jgi:bacteriocin biosynthesis cyclodehydratase domain-containing protein
MIDERPQLHSSCTVHVHAVGPFGRNAGAILRDRLPNIVVTESGHRRDAPSDWPAAGVHVLASWRPVPELCRAFERLSYATKSAFLPAIAEAPYLRIGPVIVPGSGACHTCFERRVLQHSSRRDTDLAVAQFYDAQPETGPAGFLVPFVDIAASRIEQLLAQLRTDPVSVAASIWRLETMTRQITCGRTVGIHGCPRCGLGTPEEQRSHARLRSELERVRLAHRESAAVLAVAN